MALLTVEGVYENGRVALMETPPGIAHARVMVTFIPEQYAEAVDTERSRTITRLLENISCAAGLGGRKFNREELYAERIHNVG